MSKRLPDDIDRPRCCGHPMRIKSKAESGRMRYKCSTCNTTTTNSGDSSFAEVGYDEEQALAYHTELQSALKSGDVKRLVVTAAVNNTRKNAPFFNSLQQYCMYNKAKLVVIPIHYKNISLFTGNQEYKKSWASDLLPHIIDQPLKFGRIVIRADIKIQATMVSPLAGKEPINGNLWTIFGHTQFAMETICDMLRPKRMYTTGAVTIKNYSQTNVGAKAEFHHVHGALILESNGKDIFIRHLNADSKGRFYDLDKFYTPDKVTSGHRIEALIPGDEHVKFNLPAVRQATYDNPDSIVKQLKPKYIVRHDVLDGYAGSHHHEKDDVIQFRKHHMKDNDYRAELHKVIKFINDTTPKFSRSLIVASNHTDHLYHWLSRVDPKKDPVNALLVHELKTLQYESSLKSGVYDQYDTDPFRLYARDKLKCAFRFLKRTTRYLIKGIDIGQHGDIGANGARGSAQGMAKAVTKLMIGHAHTPRIVKGVYQTGTSSGRLEYQKGLSSWTNTHGIIYKNGKRALIDIIKGGWRA